MLEPGYLPEKLDLSPSQGTSHGSGYSYDTHVPLLWYGSGIKKQDLFYPISITDIAPTLTHILNLQRTGAMTGKPIIEVLNN
jgi:bisphosphoglycerate-independent phosphoglycerate mutase (AlkP superfamily)